jgi:hypothetical protein
MARGKFVLGSLAATLALTVAPALAQRSAGGNESSGSAVSRGGGDSGGGGGGGGGAVSRGSDVGGASSSGSSVGSSSSPSSPSSTRDYVSAPTRPSQRAEAGQRSSNGGGRTGDSAVSRGGDRSSAGSRSGGDRSSAPGTTRSAGASSGSNPSDRAVPTYSRPRDGRPATGTATAREFPRVEPPRGGYGYYPGYGRYYWPGYAFGLGYYYDPFWYDPFYYGGGGYYGGGYGYPYGGAGYGSGSYDRVGTGALRLKIKPRDAEVYVDGYFVGTVDEFDGLFQKLTLDGGGHRIEIRAAGHEVIQFEVLITPGETVTYKGELKRVQ